MQRCSIKTPQRVVVIGAGIAGLACAYVARRAGHRVRVLERHNAAGHVLPHTPSYKSFGALLTQEETPGLPGLTALGVEGFTQFAHEMGVASFSFLQRRGRLMLGCDQRVSLDGQNTHGVYDAEAYDVRVGVLRRMLMQHIEHMSTPGQTCVATSVTVADAQRRTRKDSAAEWFLVFHDGEAVTADIVINAAGSDADTVDELLGVTPIGHRAKYRSMCLLPIPSEYHHRAATMPIVAVVDSNDEMLCFFKPVVLDAYGQLDQTFLPGFDDVSDREMYVQLSPGEERESHTPLSSDDARLNRAIAAAHRVTGWSFPAAADIAMRYACPRSYTPDELPRIGFHRDDATVFVCTGLGGSGIQNLALIKAMVERELGLAPSLQLPEKVQQMWQAQRFS